VALHSAVMDEPGANRSALVASRVTVDVIT
jgi:hypothetical protein